MINPGGNDTTGLIVIPRALRAGYALVDCNSPDPGTVQAGLEAPMPDWVNVVVGNSSGLVPPIRMIP